MLNGDETTHNFSIDLIKSDFSHHDLFFSYDPFDPYCNEKQVLPESEWVNWSLLDCLEVHILHTTDLSSKKADITSHIKFLTLLIF